MNLYSYVEGNPINRIDPLGLDWTKTGPEWYEWQYKYDQWERDSIRDTIDRSGIDKVPDLFHKVDPLSWFIVPPHEEHPLDGHPPTGQPSDTNKCQ